MRDLNEDLGQCLSHDKNKNKNDPSFSFLQTPRAPSISKNKNKKLV